MVRLQIAPRSAQEESIAAMSGLLGSGLPVRKYVPKYSNQLFDFELAKAICDALSVHVRLSRVGTA